MFHQITFYRQSLGPTAPALNLNGTAENVLHAVDEKKEAIWERKMPHCEVSRFQCKLRDKGPN